MISEKKDNIFCIFSTSNDLAKLNFFLSFKWVYYKKHCVKKDRIRSYSGPYFPAFELNTDQNNSEYGHFSRSEVLLLQEDK